MKKTDVIYISAANDPATTSAKYRVEGRCRLVLQDRILDVVPYDLRRRVYAGVNRRFAGRDGDAFRSNVVDALGAQEPWTSI